jgi:uncharacterized Zn-binding protein involved in type VI secretion
MPLAARVSDLTDHSGAITGPGATGVFIEKMPAARAGDAHVCAFPGAPHGPNAVVFGSLSVYIEKRPAARRGDPCACGAAIASSAFTVSIG